MRWQIRRAYNGYRTGGRVESRLSPALPHRLSGDRDFPGTVYLDHMDMDTHRRRGRLRWRANQPGALACATA